MLQLGPKPPSGSLTLIKRLSFRKNGVGFQIGKLLEVSVSEIAPPAFT
jgi:hypothetical protein